MDLGNPVETIVHYLLIGGMACLGYRHRFHMMSALLRMVTRWTKPIVNHNIRLSIVIIYQVTLLHGLPTLKEGIKFVPKSI